MNLHRIFICKKRHVLSKKFCKMLDSVNFQWKRRGLKNSMNMTASDDLLFECLKNFRYIKTLRVLNSTFAEVELKKFEITNGWQQHHDCQTGCLKLFLHNVIAQFEKGNSLKYCKIAKFKHSIF